MANTLTTQQVQDFFTAQGMPEVTKINDGASRAFAANPALNTAFAKFQVDQGAITDPTSIASINAAYTAAQQPKTIDQTMANQVNNPTIPTAGYQVPVQQQVQKNELMTGANTQIAGTQVAPAQDITTPQLGQAATATSTAVDPNTAIQYINPATGQYESVSISGATPQATAAEGTVSRESTVKGQLTDLYAEAQPGMVPEWAKGAVNNANDVMAARNLGRSTIGVAAIAGAIQQSALPIAAQDASTYFQMDIKNLDNKQQTNLVNLQVKQQSLLSDQAAANASKQFNAQSESQVQQFMASMVSQITSQNAARMDTISQFNATQENTFEQAQAALTDGTNKFNATQRTQLDAFNANLELQRQQFNATNAFAIEQSNVLWRRGVNTSNTASINAANQTNTMNAFNLSSSALNNLWQQARDNEAWLNTSQESQNDRLFQLAYLANQQQFATGQNEFDWTSAAAAWATSFFTSK